MLVSLLNIIKCVHKYCAKNLHQSTVNDKCPSYVLAYAATLTAAQDGTSCQMRYRIAWFIPTVEPQCHLMDKRPSIIILLVQLCSLT